ncbi:hypothetical protein [Xenophilus sp. Marseille-Q4582]|uniref:hypothetical protein n=1 Tax=Xenophilus sp. Marseille-Q4582 TaxID=2866600 RepID=UPI001CE3BBB8|nr:hypothetical protein [Xenophilus sp. Marseille-Q4582]
MHIRPLTALTHAEVVELAAAAADRGDHHQRANPFPPDCWRHRTFNDAFQARAAELQPA